MRELSTLIAALCNGVLLVCLIIKWKDMRWANKISLAAITVFIGLSTSVRMFVYTPGVQPAPKFLSSTYDVLFIIMSIALIIQIWQKIIRDSKR